MQYHKNNNLSLFQANVNLKRTLFIATMIVYIAKSLFYSLKLFMFFIKQWKSAFKFGSLISYFIFFVKKLFFL